MENYRQERVGQMPKTDYSDNHYLDSFLEAKARHEAEMTEAARKNAERRKKFGQMYRMPKAKAVAVDEDNY